MGPDAGPRRETSIHAPAGKILAVDDERTNLQLIDSLMTRLGYDVVTAANGEEALAAVARERPDVVLLDVDMPVLDGFETCRRLKADSATRLIPVVMITGRAAVEDRVRGIEAGADDFLAKPFVAVELKARVRSLVRLKRYTDELDSSESVILSLGRTIEARDPYTGGHCERLSRYATAFGVDLELDEVMLVALHRGGFLHDVGKVAIPDAVLLKPGPLSEAEREVMQRHTVVGDDLCRELRALQNVRAIVRHHHERLDGTGYPDGLRGAEVPLAARIIGIVDTYDAIVAERPYKRALPAELACRELRAEAARGWKDPELVERFIHLVEEDRLAPARSGT